MLASLFSSCLVTVKKNHLERGHLFAAAVKPCAHSFSFRPRAQKSAHWSPRALLYQIRIVQHATAIKPSALPIKLSAGSSAARLPALAPAALAQVQRTPHHLKLTRRSGAGLGAAVLV